MSVSVTEPDAVLEAMLNAHKKRGKDTIKSMVTTLRQLREADVDLYDFDEFEAFTEQLATSTQAKYCSHVFSYLQAKDKKDPIALLYKKRMNVLLAKINLAYQSNAFTEQQQEKLEHVNWDTLVALRDGLAAEAKAHPTDQTKMYKHLILSLYTQLPPQRADFGAVMMESTWLLPSLFTFILPGQKEAWSKPSSVPPWRSHIQSLYPSRAWAFPYSLGGPLILLSSVISLF